MKARMSQIKAKVVMKKVILRVKKQRIDLRLNHRQQQFNSPLAAKKKRRKISMQATKRVYTMALQLMHPRYKMSEHLFQILQYYLIRL
jgi:hypothetical protein